MIARFGMSYRRNTLHGAAGRQGLGTLSAIAAEIRGVAKFEKDILL